MAESSFNTIQGTTTLQVANITAGLFVSVPFLKAEHLQANFVGPATKLEHRHLCEAHQAGTVATQRKPLLVVTGTEATLRSLKVRASQTAATGNAAVTVDVLKNGASVLASVLTVNAAAATNVLTGIISDAGGVAGDLYEAVVTSTPGTGSAPVGLCVQLIVDEDPV